MRMKFVCKAVLVAAAFCVAPAAMLASPKTGQSRVGTVAFDKGASPNDTSLSLQQIQRDALSVKDSADQLQARLRAPFLNDWESDAEILDNVRADVNEMSTLLFRLRANKAEASPREQTVIGRIAPTTMELASTTQDAIVTLDNNQGRVYATDLEGLASDIYKQANLIGETVGNFEKYANARHEVEQLKQTLGLKSSS